MDDLKGLRVMVTGAYGFLGRYVVDLLKLEDPKEIVTFSRRKYDLTNESSVSRLFREHQADVVIHIAADIGGIGYSSSHPAKQYYNNVMMNTLVLHYAWLNKVQKFVGIGSVCEYPATTPVPFREDDIWNGYPVESNDAYGISKRMLLAQSMAYRREHGFNAIHLVPINLYGPRDNFDIHHSHVIPALIRKIHHGKVNGEPNVEVWGTGETSREFLYVEDAARAIIMSTKKYNDILPVNLGTGYEIKIKQLVKEIADLLQYGGEFTFNPSKPGGQQRRQLDISRAKACFGFDASTSLRDGLRKTIEYYMANIKSNLH